MWILSFASYTYIHKMHLIYQWTIFWKMQTEVRTLNMVIWETDLTFSSEKIMEYNWSSYPRTYITLTSPPRRSSLITALTIIPWDMTCLQTNSNTRFLSMLWNPLDHSHFFIIITCVFFLAFAKGIKPRAGQLCNGSWHVHRVTHNRCTTGSQLCSHLITASGYIGLEKSRLTFSLFNPILLSHLIT